MSKHFVEYVSIEDLKRWPRNPKLHDEAGVAASIKRHGFVTPLIVDETSGRLVAGHGRLEALIALHAAGGPPPKRIVQKGSHWMAPVLRGLHFRDEAEAEVYLLADNRITEGGGWDEHALLAMLENVFSNSAPEVGLSGTGYDDKELEEMYRRSQVSEADVAEHISTAVADVGQAFHVNAIKQVSIKYASEEYAQVVHRLDAIGKTLGLQTNTETIEAILDYFTASGGSHAN